MIVAGATSLLLSSDPWHGVLRSFLVLRAARQGWDVHIGAIEGGLFDATELYDVRCVQRSAAGAAKPAMSGATDFQVERAELVMAWQWPWLSRPGKSWIARVSLDGLRGTCDFTRAPVVQTPSPSLSRVAAKGGWSSAAQAYVRGVIERSSQALARRLEPMDRVLVPANLNVRADGFTIARGRYRIRTEGLRLQALQDEVGHFAARLIDVHGPESDSALPRISGWTYWKGSSLSLGDVDLGRGVHLATATLNGDHFAHHRLDWDGELRALGGTARAQGAINFSRPQLALEIGGSLEKMAVGPLAKLLGVGAETSGEVEHANFTFRGDPENWTAAEMWLAAEATDFRWGRRRWESLELRGVIINRRVQVHRLELRQSRNQLSLTGECALPSEGSPTSPAASTGAGWWKSGFSCNIDARVDDLHALAELAGDGLPQLSGRMSVNGTLSSQPGAPGIDGYLNVEGSNLSIRGAPLDSLRTTLLFKGGELDIPDVEATRGGDYFRGKGTLQILGAARYKAELHAAVKDLSVYGPAYADLAFRSQPVSGSMTLDWSGDGAPGAHSGAFQGTLEQFFTKGGPAALARPIDLAAEGTYSPESISFRHLLLKEGRGENRRDALKLEGALPWTRDPRSFAAGRWLDPERSMSVRIEFAQAPLDLLAGLAPGLVSGAEGQVSGWLNADGTLRLPKLEADLQLKNASFQPIGVPRLGGVGGRLRMDKSVLRIDQAKGRWGTQVIETTGAVDLTDTRKIGWDLTVNGNDPGGIHSETLDSGLGYALTLRSLPNGGTALAGDVGLADGKYEGALSIAPDGFPAFVWVDVARNLPFARLAAQLNLHLTATPPLSIAGGGADSWLSPDIDLSGTLEDPRITGEVTFGKAPLSAPIGRREIGDGAVYFSGDAPEDPSVSISAREPDGRETFFYGLLGSAQTASLTGSPSAEDAAPFSAAEFGMESAFKPTLLDEANGMAAFGQAFEK